MRMTIFLLPSFAACIALLPALSGAASQLQAQSAATASTAARPGISDAEFWRIFTEFSESGGTFTTENFTSNEPAVAHVSSDIVTRGRTGGAYIGVGPEQNFTYIVALRPSIAFIVDIRRQAAIQHLLFKAVFELADSRAEFVELLFALPPAVRPSSARASSIHDIWIDYLNAAPDTAVEAHNFALIISQLGGRHGFVLTQEDEAALRHVYHAFVTTGPAIHYLTGIAATAGATRSANFASLTMAVDSAGTARSFLASDENYGLVRTMHARNLIVPVVGDFAGDRALRSIADYLRGKGEIVNAFYLSNVEQYLFRPANVAADFYDNLAALPMDSTSVLIRPGTAGSNALRSPPFSRESGDSAVRAYVDELRSPGPVQRSATTLCPALAFLQAHKEGRVTAYGDAERCVR